MFSERSDTFSGELNQLTKLRLAREQAGLPILDLTAGTVGKQEMGFPSTILQEALQAGLTQAKIYQPYPLGQKVARQAVAEFYLQKGLTVDAANILLTPGSSLSYLYLFQLLCNPGDEVLCPEPGYPLFEMIAQFAGVELRYHPLKEFDEFPHWRLSLEELENRVTTKTRAIIVISPHNPTGWIAKETEVSGIADIAARHKLAIIHDEVFSEFLWTRSDLPRFVQETPLHFTLNGLSKIFALPGLKLGWIAMGGESGLITKARERLEFISDTFLPVNEAVQFALPKILLPGRSFTQELVQFYEQLMQRLSTESGFLRPEAGAYVVLKLPEGIDEEKSCERLLQDEGILIHPGSFYHMHGNHLICPASRGVMNTLGRIAHIIAL